MQLANKTAYEPQKLDAEFADGFEEIADHFSEPPARFKKQQMEATGEQLSFGTKTEPGNAGRKPHHRTKSAPRDARLLGAQFTPGDANAAARRKRPDRSANAVQANAYGGFTPGPGPSGYQADPFPPLKTQKNFLE